MLFVASNVCTSNSLHIYQSGSIRNFTTAITRSSNFDIIAVKLERLLLRICCYWWQRDGPYFRWYINYLSSFINDLNDLSFVIVTIMWLNQFVLASQLGMDKLYWILVSFHFPFFSSCLSLCIRSIHWLLFNRFVCRAPFLAITFLFKLNDIEEI